MSEPPRARVWPAAALAVGTLLWFIPTIGQPLTEPIADALKGLGLLADGTDDDAAWFMATLVLRWAATVLLLVFVLTVERRPPSSLGLDKPHRKHLLVAASLALPMTMAGVGLHLLVTGGQPEQSTQTDQIIASLSTVQLAHLIINAAVVEELFFRGFLIERVIDLTGRPALAAAAAYAIFVGSHIPGSGWASSLTVVAVGALLPTILYARTRNLFPCIVAHTVGNAPLLLSG
ncbi:Membrane protease YdiL, CAAX protease family [Thermomonospora echinospora]|uniref:Membrane protease YdiL, CAAX protease family n=1 Tax=Thermomonospora echinospora TaxID=1992 RepID=A0A1H6CTP1_9ACTN|nr:CPBP family intramembrane glutamic endopeptidase [Thermomonospora echinospora]SEG76218.1 Membrane protease YdiL, CAAX protease family [Thermomonospora echinospora]